MRRPCGAGRAQLAVGERSPEQFKIILLSYCVPVSTARTLNFEIGSDDKTCSRGRVVSALDQMSLVWRAGGGSPGATSELG